MSLLITSPIQTIEGIELAGAYGRVAVADQISGTKLQTQAVFFASKEAYLAGANSLNVNFNTALHFDYSRATMGGDILDIAHDALIQELANNQITATKDLTD